ncbi:MAG: SDR family oxidoreductase [Pseudobacteriovorax sp.]|nr:SDR family oxidoreductase [Pseudobacteriovorax sp.]
MKTAIITGANGGLGVALSKCFAERGYKVIATVRDMNKSTSLDDLINSGANVEKAELDVSSDSSIESFLNLFFSNHSDLDVLINNAGINSKSNGEFMPQSSLRLGSLERESLNHIIDVNCTGPLLLTQGLIHRLQTGNAACVINISSWLGSIGKKTGGGNYGYCGSKSLVNMFTRALAFDLQEYGVRVFAVNPGWMRTKMGGVNATLNPEDSAEGILKIATDLPVEETGGFFNHDGSKHEW